MSWDTPAPKTALDLFEADKFQKDQIVKEFQAKLNDLEQKIAKAKDELNLVVQDIDGAYQQRRKEYAASEVAIREEINKLNVISDKTRLESEDLEIAKKNFQEYMDKENQQLSLDRASLIAKQDQNESLRKELDGYAAIQVQVRDEQAKTQEEHVARKKELDQCTIDMNTATEKILAQHHELKQGIAAHQVNLDALIEREKLLEVNQQKNIDFYNAVLAREQALEPLKKKYEDGIASNEAEASKLRDANIESYKIHRDAQARLDLAVAAEQRVKTESANLDALKNEIHAKIKQEA